MKPTGVCLIVECQIIVLEKPASQSIEVTKALHKTVKLPYFSINFQFCDGQAMTWSNDGPSTTCTTSVGLAQASSNKHKQI